MKPLASPQAARAESRGAALVLSFMVLLILILILAQIKYSTDTNARVSRNEETLITMDLAIESAMLQVFEDLKSDASSDAAGGMPDSGSFPGGGGAPSDGAPAEEGGEGSGATDSHEDEWARPQRTEVNEIQLRILIQDEDSKYNVLSVLTEDEDEADKAVDRLARVIEWSRKGTSAEIDGSTARRMATTIAEYMKRRSDQVLPRPKLLTDDEDHEDIGLPLSLREFVAVEPEIFPEDLFRDFVDEDGDVVHSLGTFLTVWSSVTTLDEAQSQASEGQAPPDDPGEENDGNGAQDQPQDPPGGQPSGGETPEPAPSGGGQDNAPPGWAINLNTAPGAVLHALMPERELPYRFWDEVVTYRNEKDDAVEENEDPPLDEYGREIITHQFFHSVDDLSQVDGWENLEPIVQAEVRDLLKVQSQVFSIYITARKPTGTEELNPFSDREDVEEQETNWQGLVRTVHAVVWRRTLGEGEVTIVPLVRWEVLDYLPYQLLDFPEQRSTGSRR